MSTSNYKTTNTLGTGVIYDYFYLNGTNLDSIKSSFNEIPTDGAQLKLVGLLTSNLKHVNPIGYKINYTDIYNLYVPKCYVWFGPIVINNFVVPSITTRIVFLLQAPGGWGANGSTSPNNNGGDGGSGSLCFGYMNKNNNPNTDKITINITGSVFNSASIQSSISFSGGNLEAVYCWSGAAATTTNQGGAGGIAPTFDPSLNLGSLAVINAVAGTNGSDNSRIATESPYVNYSPTANTAYFPLVTGNYGYGGVGGNFGGSGAAGNDGIAAIWFLL